jgi:hypothetical protein
VLRRNLTTGIAGCCAGAASGHAAAPPMSAMKFESFIITMIYPVIPAEREARAGIHGHHSGDQLAIPENESCQSGFRPSTKASFLSRRHFFNCFSRSIAWDGIVEGFKVY